ncbi:probable nucleoredoxin 1 isoform X2 [Daucus carota subsp. sativus]|uniref:probable nucleoredoxin 1 isoform X2 n=1 Tax=Daucus carota subsp. sativus TaxID=79200 RepID=UPI0007F00370|nr:PREDICTED: probable nucleoredoxin 1 isoform X2 [Daucus carota subsp. sativus]
MVASMCLRRLMCRRKEFATNYNNFNNYNTTKVSTSRERCDKRIEKGDFVDLSTLLFTANRDYLVKYNHPQQVRAEQLAGKVIGIYFLPLRFLYDRDGNEHSKALMGTYNDLKSKNCFEVVLVVVDEEDVTNEPGKISFNPSLEGKLQDIFSRTPSWLAIPFSDITSRQRLKRKFGFFGELYYPKVVLIDSAGMVLDTSPEKLFQTYGYEAYPFSDERISFLKIGDKTAFSQPSLKSLLGSSERDFVISNKGYKVPIYTLEDKVVALFFYEDGYSPDHFTSKLKMYYAELKRRNENFEVILLYLYDTYLTISSTSEETFRKTFNTMPWLALPYKDPAVKKLRRVFGYPYEEEDESLYDPTLVIVGPRPDIIEPGLATILRGYDANLFMYEESKKPEGGRVWELKLEMLCSSETVFQKNDGSQVQFSQLAGKRIIFLFEGDYPEYDGVYFRKTLEKKYMHMKGTADEFEVIYFPNSKDKNYKRVADVPWLVSCSVELLPGCSDFLSFYGKSCNRYQSSFLLAFDRDGSLVRKTISPQFGNNYFPFYADDVETEAFDFCWDTLFEGLLRHSIKQIYFTAGDLLFCVYCYQWTH